MQCHTSGVLDRLRATCCSCTRTFNNRHITGVQHVAGKDRCTSPHKIAYCWSRCFLSLWTSLLLTSGWKRTRINIYGSWRLVYSVRWLSKTDLSKDASVLVYFFPSAFAKWITSYNGITMECAARTRHPSKTVDFIIFTWRRFALPSACKYRVRPCDVSRGRI